MIKVTTPVRLTDAWGSGKYLASRGKRLHQGVDFAALPRSRVHAVLPGVVTKLGICYSDTLRYKYVEVTDDRGYRIRYFYVKPVVKVGTQVQIDDILGLVQNLSPRYKNITNHIHLEVMKPLGNNQKIDPVKYLEDIRCLGLIN